MLRIIQAGMGGWGRDWAKSVLKPDDQVSLVACVDADPASLALAREQLDLPGGELLRQSDAALAAVEADAVLITANLPGHVPLALEALRAGKHVLLEKPFAPSVAEARQVVDLAAEHGRVLMISQNYRFFPAVQAVRDLVRSGSLGEVGAVSIDFRRYANAAPREGHRHYTLHHPLLADMAIHHFDLMRAVLGQEPVEITCHAWNPPWSNFEEPAAAFATISFDGGAVVSYRGSWVSPGRRPPGQASGAWSAQAARSPGPAATTTARAWIASRCGRWASAPGAWSYPRSRRSIALAACEPLRGPSLRGSSPKARAATIWAVSLMYAAIEAATTGVPVRMI